MINHNSVEGLSRKELDNMIQKRVSIQVQELQKQLLEKKEKPKLLSRIQTAEYLGIDLSTLYSWVNQGRIKMYSMGSKRYFKENEVIDSLIHLNPNNHGL